MGCGNRLNNFLIKTDFLSKQFELKPNSNQKNGTALGGTLTWLILVFITLFTIGKYLQETFQTQNTLAGETIQIDQSSIYYDNNMNQIGIYFMERNDEGAHFISLEEMSQEISVKVELIQKQKNSQGFNLVKTELELQECNLSSADRLNLNGTITNTIPRQLYCIKDYYNLTSEYNQDISSFLSISFSTCDVNTVICNFATTTNYLYYVKLVILQSLLPSEQSQTSQTSEKLNYIPTIYEYSINHLIFEEASIRFSKIVIKQREEGLLSNLFKSAEFQVISEGVVYLDQTILKETRLPNTPSPLLTISFYNSGLQRVILLDSQSTVIKMCQNLANFGGLLGMIGLFYSFYQKHKVIVNLMTNTFYFDYQQNEKDKNGEKRTKELENHIMANQKVNLHSSLGKKLDYSFYQFLWMKTKEMCQMFIDLFGLNWSVEDKNEKMRIYRMAEQKIEQDLDIIHILQRLYDIDKLKLLLLDDDQLQLFNTLAKPVIKINRKKSLRLQRNSTMTSQMMRVSQFFQCSATIQDGKTLFRIYQNIKDNKNKNIEMNKKILQLVKEHDLVQNILNKEELVLQIKERLLQRTEQSDDSDLKDKHESEQNKSCPKEISANQDSPVKSIKSSSLVNNYNTTKQSLRSLNQQTNLKFKNHFQFLDESSTKIKKIDRYKTLEKLKQSDCMSDSLVINPLRSQRTILLSISAQTNKKIGIRKGLSTSLDEFEADKYRGNHANQLNVWTQKENPFKQYKTEKEDQKVDHILNKININCLINEQKQQLEVIEETFTDNEVQTNKDKNYQNSNDFISRQSIYSCEQNKIDINSKMLDQFNFEIRKNSISTASYGKQNEKYKNSVLKHNDSLIPLK